MTRHQHAAQWAPGLIGGPKSPARLYVKTGLDDDARRPLESSHPLYGLALHAWRRQDCWSLAEHRDFWTDELPLWPRRRGQRSLREMEGWWTHELRRADLDDAAIADVLAVEVDTIRRRRLHDAGEMVWHEQVDPAERHDGPRPPLPRVYALGEDAPRFSYVNLPLLLTVSARSPAARRIEALAVTALREALTVLGHPERPGAPNAPKSAQTDRIRGGAERR